MTWRFKQSVKALLTAPRSVQLVDFGKRKAVSAKKSDTKGYHGRQPPDSRTACTTNGDRQATEYRGGCAGTDGPPGRLPGVGEVPSGPRNEDMGARNGPQGTQAALRLIRSAPGRAPSGYGRVSGARTEAMVEEGVRKEDSVSEQRLRKYRPGDEIEMMVHIQHAPTYSTPQCI